MRDFTLQSHWMVERLFNARKENVFLRFFTLIIFGDNDEDFGIDLDAGGVFVGGVEDVDETEEDGDQQPHPPRHNLKQDNYPVF